MSLKKFCFKTIGNNLNFKSVLIADFKKYIMKSLKIFSLALICMLCLNFDHTPKPITVVIDAGHGGKDTGVTIKGSSEKDIVYAISKKIKKLENKNVDVFLLRHDDRFLSLQERVEKINALKPDLVLSLHIDSNSDTASSITEAYIEDDNTKVRESHYFASKLLSQLTKKETKVKFAGFYILRHTESAAVNLSLGNFNNPEDYAFLTSEWGQDHIAKQILAALD